MAATSADNAAAVRASKRANANAEDADRPGPSESSGASYAAASSSDTRQLVVAAVAGPAPFMAIDK
eukprot:11984244-Alexandrium_andersonii.AAC.1